VCYDKTYASLLGGKPLSPGAFVRGERSSELSKPRLGRPERDVPHMYFRRVQVKRFIE